MNRKRAVEFAIGGFIGLLVGLMIAGCGPAPTESSFESQSKTPVFKALAYEKVKTGWDEMPVKIVLFEDVVGNCFITSGVDGGISLAPKSSCDAAKALNVERMP